MSNEVPENDDILTRLNSFEAEAASEGEYIEAEMKAEQQQAEQGEAERMAAEHGAIMAVSFAETLLKMKYPYVAIDDSTKARLVEKTAPVMLKHGGGLPEWLQPYREEIELGMVVAVAGFGVFMQVKAHQAAEEAAREAEEEDGAVSA